MEADTWEPFCGAEYPQDRISGDPIVCTSAIHDDGIMHCNDELAWVWW